MKKIHVCKGNCQAVVSDEEYKKGLTHCGAESCSKFGKPFEEQMIDTDQSGKN